MQNLHCPECGGELHRDVQRRTLEYKKEKVTYDQPGWFCNVQDCNGGFYNAEDMKHLNLVAAGLKARAENILHPDDVREIRKRLGLTQREAGELLGGGIRAFNKYESGNVAVSMSMNNLLRLLDRHPHLLDELRK